MAPKHELASTRRPIGAGVWIGVCACGFETPGLKKRVQAVRHIKGHIVRKATQPWCPTPRAPRFRTEAKATAALSSRWRKPRPGQLHAHTYRCQCGYWHNSKKARP